MKFNKVISETVDTSGATTIGDVQGIQSIIIDKKKKKKKDKIIRRPIGNFTQNIGILEL